MAITKNIRKKKRNNTRRKSRGGVNGGQGAIQNDENIRRIAAKRVADIRLQAALEERERVRAQRLAEEQRKRALAKAQEVAMFESTTEEEEIPQEEIPQEEIPQEKREEEAASIDSSQLDVIFMMSSMSEAVKDRVKQIIDTNLALNPPIITDVVFAMCPFNVRCYLTNKGINELNILAAGKTLIQTIKDYVNEKGGKFIPIDVPQPCFIPIIRDVINEPANNGGLLESWPNLGPAGGKNRIPSNKDTTDKKGDVFNISPFRSEILFDFLLYLYLDFLHTQNSNDYFTNNRDRKENIKIVISFIYTIEPDEITTFFEDIAQHIMKTVHDKIGKNSTPEDCRAFLEANDLEDDVREDLRNYLVDKYDKFKLTCTGQRIINKNNDDLSNALLKLYDDANFPNIIELENSMLSFNSLPKDMLKSERDKTKGHYLFKKLEQRRVDSLLKMFNPDYEGAFIDVNFAVPLLGLHYKLLEMKDTLIGPTNVIQQAKMIETQEYIKINKDTDEGWALATQDANGAFTMPYKKIITKQDNENKLMNYINTHKETLKLQSLYNKIHCITDLESDDLLALKVLQPHFEQMELYLCENPNYPQLTSEIKEIILEPNMPSNVTISETIIKNTFVNLKEIQTHISPKCFEDIDKNFPLLKEKREQLALFLKPKKIPISGGKKRKTRKLRKTRKTRKSRKSRKTRKSRK